ncbi:flagellar hook-basal body complex protein FliE [Pseudoroseicyclus aestuarii]|uniref:Flagellar hook-basal body complex protein FliE n=1 Tax=Pseudoroseicyclus aestuarii TaxID=1795041 RepID=A0A318SRQ6_9RHOB|nr:flagellar hook-basal body complex protein FliE [Pseudoroseicyclus aestuarii]PYE84500.1 flagellar hook-basal body complex protein FliE [Pseudoroseicyclus aestuarii]
MADFSTLVSSGAVRGAYRSAQSLAAERGPLVVEEAPPSFAEALSQAASTTMENVRASEEVMQRGLVGEAETQAVIEATLAMEQTLKIAVSVRDKLVEAYRDIMQMPI